MPLIVSLFATPSPAPVPQARRCARAARRWRGGLPRAGVLAAAALIGVFSVVTTRALLATGPDGFAVAVGLVVPASAVAEWLWLRHRRGADAVEVADRMVFVVMFLMMVLAAVASAIPGAPTW